MKKFIITILILFSLTLSSAHSIEHNYKEKFIQTKYSPEEHTTFSTTIYIDYENEKRFSTHDYRHGYSYRTTQEYLNKHYPHLIIVENSKNLMIPKYNDDKYKDYYYEYTEHLREFEKRDCYNRPPKNKIFYIKCP